VIFYHRGQFLSRDNIHPGMVVDARDALDVAPLPEGVEWLGYVDSWKGAPP
jgi:homogentisate 1,2-dioxygenase